MALRRRMKTTLPLTFLKRTIDYWTRDTLAYALRWRMPLYRLVGKRTADYWDSLAIRWRTPYAGV